MRLPAPPSWRGVRLLHSLTHVDRSSGFHDLDAAAVQAVQGAVLPPKQAELAVLDHFVFHLGEPQ